MYDLFCSFSGNLPKSVGSFWRNCGVDVASYNGDNDGDDDDDYVDDHHQYHYYRYCVKWKWTQFNGYLSRKAVDLVRVNFCQCHNIM